MHFKPTSSCFRAVYLQKGQGDWRTLRRRWMGLCIMKSLSLIDNRVFPVTVIPKLLAVSPGQQHISRSSSGQSPDRCGSVRGDESLFHSNRHKRWQISMKERLKIPGIVNTILLKTYRNACSSITANKPNMRFPQEHIHCYFWHFFPPSVSPSSIVWWKLHTSLIFWKNLSTWWLTKWPSVDCFQSAVSNCSLGWTKLNFLRSKL